MMELESWKSTKCVSLASHLQRWRSGLSLLNTHLGSVTAFVQVNPAGRVQEAVQDLRNLFSFAVCARYFLCRLWSQLPHWKRMLFSLWLMAGLEVPLTLEKGIGSL